MHRQGDVASSGDFNTSIEAHVHVQCIVCDH